MEIRDAEIIWEMSNFRNSKTSVSEEAKCDKHGVKSVRRSNLRSLAIRPLRYSLGPFSRGHILHFDADMSPRGSCDAEITPTFRNFEITGLVGVK